MKILFATNNPAKIRYYGEKLKKQGLEIMTPADLQLSAKVIENGKTPVENAMIKAQAFYQLSHLVTLAMDDGLYFDQLDEHLQPGTHVRRINGKRLNDREMIHYYTSLVSQYGTNGYLEGYFLKGTAIVYDNQIFTHSCKLPRRFSNRASKVIDTGYPLASIQIIPGIEKFKSEMTEQEEAMTMDIEQQEIFQFLFETLNQLK